MVNIHIMGKIICISNLKGGTGKTTTAVNLAASLSVFEKRTLVIDCDPQGNLSIAFGIDRNNIKKDLYRALMGEVDLLQVIMETGMDFLRIIPSRFELLNAEARVSKTPGGEAALRKLLDQVKDQYDFIIIDSPPSLGFFSVMSLVASDWLIVPIQFHIFSMEGLARMLPLVQRVRKTVNQNLKIAGILITMTGSTGKMMEQQAEEAAESIRKSVFKTIIPFDEILSECSEIGIPVILKDIDSKVAKAYLDFAEELLEYFS